MADQLSDSRRAELEAQAEGLDPAVQEQAAERVKEYGTFVALNDINFGGVRAYNAGDPVPVANVEQYEYDKLGWVARRSSKEGKAALQQAAEPATSPAQPVPTVTPPATTATTDKGK